MWIELSIKRPGGSEVQLGTETYHFAPNEQGQHIAFVENEDHIDRLLQIPQYRRARIKAEAPALPSTEPEVVKETVTVTKTVTVTERSTDGDEGEVEGDGDGAAGEATTNPPASVIPKKPEIPNYDKMTDAELSQIFQTKFNRLPNPRSSREKLIDRLIVDDRAGT